MKIYIPIEITALVERLNRRFETDNEVTVEIDPCGEGVIVRLVRDSEVAFKMRWKVAFIDGVKVGYFPTND